MRLLRILSTAQRFLQLQLYICIIKKKEHRKSNVVFRKREENRPLSPPPKSLHMCSSASLSLRFFSSLETPQEGVISPTMAVSTKIIEFDWKKKRKEEAANVKVN